MFEKFISGNARDFKARYEGTYGFFRENGKRKMLARLDSISERACHFVDARGAEYTLNADTVEEIGFEFLPPKACYYNLKDGTVVLVSRMASRQWKRGVSSANTAVYTMDKVYGALAPSRLDFKVLENIYQNSVDPSAVKYSKGDNIAISRAFAFSRTGEVRLYENKVGNFVTEDAKHFKVVLAEPDLWRTEITDALRSMSKTVEVA